MFYSKESNVFLAGYSDADWVGNADDRKSGWCFYVGTNLVAWMSKKQNSVSLSTTEVEYIAAGSCCSQLLFMKKLLSDYSLSQETIVVTVIILVLLISLRIWYNILRLNI